VNVALPSIQADLGFSSEDLQWVVNGYTLLFGGFLLLGGRAADLFGRKRLFLAGVAIFSFASLLNALAESSGVLVAARGLQGLGAALVSPAALTEGFTTAFAIGAGLMFAGVLVVATLLRRRDVAHVRAEALPVPA